MNRLALVFAHQGAKEARLFAQSVRTCREMLDLYVVGVYGSEALPDLGIEDETIRVRHWHSLSAAWNCGILHALHAGVETVLVANDDTVLSAVAVERLQAHLAQGRWCACPCVAEIPSIYPWWQPLFPPGSAEAYQQERSAWQQGEDAETVFARWYARWDGFDAFAHWMAEHNQGQTHQPYFHGVAFMAAARLFEEVGLFDLRFRPAYHEDADYAKRIAALGVDSVLAFDAYFHHWGGATSSRQGEWGEVFARNEQKLAEKERKGFYNLLLS